MRAVVVVPTYNEAGTIESLLDALLRTRLQLDVLVVDGNSPDGTTDVARTWADRHALTVNVLTQRERNGLGGAYRAGFARALAAGYDVVVQMDADGSHPASAIREMLAAVSNGSDLVIGSRYTPGGCCDKTWPLHRKLISKAGNVYARALLRLPVRDLTGGFKAWRADTLAQALATGCSATGYAFQVEMTAAAATPGTVITEFPIVFTDRREGQSKMSASVALEAAFLVPRLRQPNHGLRSSHMTCTAPKPHEAIDASL